jgi:hypothetical protein
MSGERDAGVEDARRALAAWLAARGLAPLELAALAGDVSPRLYFRVRFAPATAPAESVVAAFYPPAARAACARFLASGRLMAAAGVRVPETLAADSDAGVMLLEDLGARTLYEFAPGDWRTLGPYLEAAVRTLDRLRQLPPGEVAALNPPLDAELLRRELEQTWRVFLEPRGLLADAALARELGELLDRICGELGAEPRQPCHRDFMARNLVPLAATPAQVAVLDHQDLRLGPPGYDLASLLNDSLFPPAALAERLRQAAGVGERSYRLAAVQRTLKAVGTFAAFAARGSPRHLPLVAPTLERCVENLEALGEDQALAARLRRLWRPAIC